MNSAKLIRSLINSVKLDLAITARMQGCYPVAYNYSVPRYFPEKRVMELDTAVKAGPGTKNVCDVLGAPPTILVVFCPMEVAYIQLRKLRKADSTDAVWSGFHTLNGAEDGTSRVFDLFRFFARQIDNKHVLFRFLPFPGTMKVRLTNGKNSDWCFKELCKLPLLPESVRVEVEGLGYDRTVHYEELPAQSKEKLRTARRFLNRLLIYLLESPYHSPAAAWAKAIALDDFRGFNAAREIPDPVVQQFTRTSTLDHNVEIATKLAEGCANGLDASALSDCLFSALEERLQKEDRSERLRPDYFDSFEDRARYSRLHLLPEELWAQDQYVGWLPMEKAYRDERSVVLDEIYGNHFGARSDKTA